MKYLKVIAFSHKQLDIKEIGCLVLCNEAIDIRLAEIRAQFDVSEIFYLATCNRVEFVFYTSQELNKVFIKSFLETMRFPVPPEKVAALINNAMVYEDEAALNHLMRMSSSLESLIVGEKEILAQVRKSYENCRKKGFTSDFLRIVMSRVVKTAKEVYTYTNISKNPISVVSLAYRKLRDLRISSNSRILIIGAGETNQNIAKYLKKHKYNNFSIFNRTFEKAQALAAELGGKAYNLHELSTFNEGFDVIITCTGCTEYLITPEVYKSLLNNESQQKIIVDLAVPNDTHPDVLKHFPVHFIEVQTLQDIANKNLQERYTELINAERIIEQNIMEFRPILKQRRVEMAMRKVPEKIKEIRNTACNGIFADEINSLDPSSREILEKVMNYMEKKYISVPMVMAKEILVNNN